MNDQKRILMFGQRQESVDRVVQILEGVGFTVTSTLNDVVAVDLAGASDYDALLIGEDVPQPDLRYVRAEARKRRSSIRVVIVHSPESVLTQVTQAGIKI